MKPARHKLAACILILGAQYIEQASAAFIISADEICRGNDAYSYRFLNESPAPDYKVQVSESTVLPDITLKLVDDASQADLIFVDESDNSDRSVCRIGRSATMKTIVVSENEFLPDIKVTLSETPFLPDYTIYVRSRVFTRVEAAAIFAVIWMENHER